MRSNGYGRIVLTSSITGSLVGQPGYSALRSLQGRHARLHPFVALEVADAGITVNAVLPGNIRTPGFDDLGPAHEQAMLAAIPFGMSDSPRMSGGRCASWPRLRRVTSPARRS